MSISLLCRWFVSAVLICVCGMVRAQNCLPPQPFVHSFQNLGVAALQGAADTPCALSSSLNSAAGPNAAAFVHYRRPAPTTSVRYSFRMDDSAVATSLTSVLRNVQIFSASASSLQSNAGFPAHLLLVYLSGQASTPTISIIVACGGTPSKAIQLPVALPGNVNTLRFEINTGSGTAGSLRYWINADFTDAPTGIIDNNGVGLDNAAWGGVIAAELGMSSGSNGFRTNSGGGAIVFDQIQTSDDVLFWQNFELDQQ